MVKAKDIVSSSVDELECITHYNDICTIPYRLEQIDVWRASSFWITIRLLQALIEKSADI